MLKLSNMRGSKLDWSAVSTIDAKGMLDDTNQNMAATKSSKGPTSKGFGVTTTCHDCAVCILKNDCEWMRLPKGMLTRF
jgi:hypothetical protein